MERVPLARISWGPQNAYQTIQESFVGLPFFAGLLMLFMTPQRDDDCKSHTMASAIDGQLPYSVEPLSFMFLDTNPRGGFTNRNIVYGLLQRVCKNGLSDLKSAFVFPGKLQCTTREK